MLIQYTMQIPKKQIISQNFFNFFQILSFYIYTKYGGGSLPLPYRKDRPGAVFFLICYSTAAQAKLRISPLFSFFTISQDATLMRL